MNCDNKKCVFAGTFDPPTLGHQSVIDDCLAIFDEVVLAIGVNPDKKPKFSLEERKEMLKIMYPNEPRLKVVDFQGTVVELLKKENTKTYVRGIRNGTDFDYETSDFYASKKLAPDLRVIYIPCRQDLLHVSSSMVRNSLRFDTPIEEYVTQEVQAYITNIEKKNERK